MCARLYWIDVPTSKSACGRICIFPDRYHRTDWTCDTRCQCIDNERNVHLLRTHRAVRHERYEKCIIVQLWWVWRFLCTFRYADKHVWGRRFKNSNRRISVCTALTFPWSLTLPFPSYQMNSLFLRTSVSLWKHSRDVLARVAEYRQTYANPSNGRFFSIQL